MKCIIVVHAFHIHFSDNSLIYQSESVPSLSVFHEIDIGQRNHSFCIFLSSILSPWFCVDNGERNEKVAENFQIDESVPLDTHVEKVDIDVEIIQRVLQSLLLVYIMLYVYLYMRTCICISMHTVTNVMSRSVAKFWEGDFSCNSRSMGREYREKGKRGRTREILLFNW